MISHDEDPINLVVLLPVLCYKIGSKGEGQVFAFCFTRRHAPPLPSYRLTRKTRMLQLSW
ncbi:rCG38123 [Rattus norvegicus]|uniref:RCG38123 n=1 Tax=Rattus norvegicus TaxID=10116 RepID=A6IV09_RAT|nr:rCG38123 [Rattus norvegicus]